jgi:hypothetical protein
MNWTEMQDNWCDMQAILPSYWTLLTHDDLVAIDRSRTRLISTLQRIYKLSESQAESCVCYFEKTIRKPGATV